MSIRMKCLAWSLLSCLCLAGGAPAAADEARAKAIAKQAADALGGVEKLAAVKELVTTGKLTLQTPMGELSGESRTEVAFPNKLRSLIALPMGDVVQGFDGTTAWMTMASQPMEVPPAMANESRRGIATAGGITMLRKALSGEATVDTLEPAEVAGRKVDVVAWKEGEIELKASYDAETHLLARLAYRASTPQGDADVVVTLGDYREVAGLKFPFSVSATQNGQRYLDMTVIDVKVNPGVDPSKFARP